MLVHIPPILQRFACEHRPIFNGLAAPGSVSRTIPGPPRAQSPFARLRRYPSRRDVSSMTSEGVTPPSLLLRTHAPDQNPPVLFGFPYSTGPCRLLPVPAGRWSPGRPEEFHHQSPPEPYMNLSAHTARASHSLGASRHQVDKEREKLLPDPWLATTPFALTHPLRSMLITGTSSLLQDDPPPSCASILSPFVGPPLIGFSLTIT